MPAQSDALPGWSRAAFLQALAHRWWVRGLICVVIVTALQGPLATVGRTIVEEYRNEPTPYQQRPAMTADHPEAGAEIPGVLILLPDACRLPAVAIDPVLAAGKIAPAQ